MKSDTQSQQALFLVSTSILLVLFLLGFSDALQRVEWFEPRMVGMPALACAVLGTLLGWLNFGSTAGKLAAVIGSSMLLYVLVVFIAKSAPLNQAEASSQIQSEQRAGWAARIGEWRPPNVTPQGTFLHCDAVRIGDA